MKLNLAVLMAASVAVLSGAIFAQRSVVVPAEYERAWGRGSSSLLGGSSTRTQLVFAQPFAAGLPVFGVGFRPTAGTVDRAAFTVDVEIQMSSTANAPGALSPMFASNIGSDVMTALPRQMVNVGAMPANRPTSQFATFPFPQPFLFGTNGNTNLNVDVSVFGRTAGATWSTDRGFASTGGRATTAGMGCGSALASSSSSRVSGSPYVAGETLTLSLSGAQPSGSALLLPSVDMSEFAPGIPLPFDLSRLGAGAGCDLLVNPSIGTFPAATDAAGAASINLTLPSGIGRFGTGWQWAYIVPMTGANPLGLETTANRAVWIGPEVLVPSAQYVWHLSNVASPTGTATTDSCPVVQFRVP